MHIKSLALFLSATRALPSDDGRHDGPDSAAVVEALTNPEVYEQLSRHHHRNSLQTPFVSNTVLDNKHGSSHATCGAGARTGCPAFEGETRRINGRKYNLYCHNAPWGAYFWLPKSESLAECEHHCHSHDYDCNGLTFYPATGACSIIHSQDAAPYIWDNGYQKISAIPIESEVALGPGELCPLPGSDNQVWDFNNQRHQFKLSCRNQFNVQPQNRKQEGPVHDVDECAEKCGNDDSCFGFHYYQPVFPGGRLDGARNCELITERVKEGDWVPIHKPDQYLAGLMVNSFSCADEGWNRDHHNGNRRHRDSDRRRRHRHGRDGRGHDEEDDNDDVDEPDSDFEDEHNRRGGNHKHGRNRHYRNGHHGKTGRDREEDDSIDEADSGLEDEHNRRGGNHKHGRNRHHRNGRHGKTGRDWEEDDSIDETDGDFEDDQHHRRGRSRNGRNRRGHGGRHGRQDDRDWEEDNDEESTLDYEEEHHRRGDHHRGRNGHRHGGHRNGWEDFEDEHRHRGNHHRGHNDHRRSGHNDHRLEAAPDL